MYSDSSGICAYYHTRILKKNHYYYNIIIKLRIRYRLYGFPEGPRTPEALGLALQESEGAKCFHPLGEGPRPVSTSDAALLRSINRAAKHRLTPSDLGRYNICQHTFSGYI